MKHLTQDVHLHTVPKVALCKQAVEARNKGEHLASLQNSDYVGLNVSTGPSYLTFGEKEQ